MNVQSIPFMNVVVCFNVFLGFLGGHDFYSNNLGGSLASIANLSNLEKGGAFFYFAMWLLSLGFLWNTCRELIQVYHGKDGGKGRNSLDGQDDRKRANKLV